MENPKIDKQLKIIKITSVLKEKVFPIECNENDFVAIKTEAVKSAAIKPLPKSSSVPNALMSFFKVMKSCSTPAKLSKKQDKLSKAQMKRDHTFDGCPIFLVKRFSILN